MKILVAIFEDIFSHRRFLDEGNEPRRAAILCADERQYLVEARGNASFSARRTPSRGEKTRF